MPRLRQGAHPRLVTEASARDPRDTYAVTRMAQEHLAAAWVRETGGAAASLRLHTVYGPGMPRNTPYAGVAALFLSCLDRGEPPRAFEDGGQRRDFVHVDDFASAFVADIVADTSGHLALNVGCGVVSTIVDVARALSVARRGPDPVVTGEFRLGDVQ